MVQAGDIVVFNATKGGWFSAAQRFFTRMPYTHTGIIIGDVNDESALLEAKMSVSVTPWKPFTTDPTLQYWVFRPAMSVNPQALSDLWHRYAGHDYGYFQILWFVYRWIMESWPFRADVRGQHNWFPTGDICSEVTYNWIQWLSMQDPLLDALVMEWNENTCHSGDIYTICSKSRLDFTLVEFKNTAP